MKISNLPGTGRTNGFAADGPAKRRKNETEIKKWI